MIQNVVFDMGQVLIHWSPSLFVQALDLSEGERVLLAREVYGKEEWARLDFGDISEEEAIAAISLRVPPQLRQYVPRLVQDWWGLCLKPMAGMADFVRDLKKNGKGVYC